MDQTPVIKEEEEDDDDNNTEHRVSQMDPEELWQALTSIAEEVQNYRNNHSSINDLDLKESKECDCEEKLQDLKMTLKSKQKTIKNLQENLNTACLIAKTALTAQENDRISYNNKLDQVQNQSASLQNQYAKCCEKLKILVAENKVSSDTLKNMDSFINVGYLEVLKMLHEEPEDISLLMKLKKIMISCGQYYADFCNERDRNVQLEQKNRFLQNKLNILETNIAGLMQELKKCKCNKGPKDNKTSKCCRAAEYLSSNHQMDNVSPCASTTNTINKYEPVRQTESFSNITACSPACNLDLSAHFTLVQDLLTDQDSMLKDLKSLANELDSLNVCNTR